MSGPEQKNYAEIQRREGLLADLRASPVSARETEAIREIGLEIALAIREVGATLERFLAGLNRPCHSEWQNFFGVTPFPLTPTP
jgi:hypothetical protein